MNTEAILHEANPWWRDPSQRFRSLRPVARPELARVLRHIESSDRAVLIRGMRQTGKTVLLRQTIDRLLEAGAPAANITFFDFEDERVHRDTTPEEVLGIEPPGFDPQKPRFAFFDEISRFEGWSKWIKKSVDATRHGSAAERNRRFVLTDSSAALLDLGSVESAQGRLHEIEVEGVDFRTWVAIASDGVPDTIERALELPETLDSYLLSGGFPGQILAAKRKDYAELRRTLRADIVSAGIHRDLHRLRVDTDSVEELFRYLIEESGAIFNRKKRGEDLGADPRAIAKWLDHLLRCHLVVRLDLFATRAAKRLRESGRPKIYARDHGLVAAFAVVPDPLSDPDTKARIYECVVFRHLRGIADEREARVRFYRDERGNQEVDFVVEHGIRRIALEVKSGRRATQRENLEKLRSVGARLEATRTVLVTDGFEAATRDGIDILPLAAFLKDPRTCTFGALAT